MYVRFGLEVGTETVFVMIVVVSPAEFKEEILFSFIIQTKMTEVDFIPQPGIFQYGETVNIATEEQLNRLPTDIINILRGIVKEPPVDSENITDYTERRNLWIQSKLANNEWFNLDEFRSSPLPTDSQLEECNEQLNKKIRRDF